MDLNSLIRSKKLQLKKCKTIVTNTLGQKYVEIDGINTELSSTATPFVIDDRPDLQIAHVIQGLFLSSQDPVVSKEILQKRKIRHVLSIGIDASVKFDDIKYYYCDLLDLPESDLLLAIKKCIKIIHEHRDENILVHCNAGVSRSPAIVISYIMAYEKVSYDDAYNKVKSVRSCIKPNEGFVQHRDIVDRVMKSVGQQLVITKSVNELLFEGYEDTILQIAQKINFTEIPFTKFAWFYGRNGSASYDGTFNMLTGKSNLLDVGIVKEWNFNNRVSYYPGECGEIRGTNGDLWPPLPDNKTVSFFVPDICTSMSVTYDNTTIHEGLIGVRYISDDTTFDNGSIVPSRSCYCEGECVPSGALNISLCKWGAPAFISLPHFYLADPSYRENINGMKPSKEKHELSISIEPKTGVPLNVHAQLQLNLLIQPDHEMSIFKNIKKTFIPMLWFTQEAYLTSNYAHIIKFIIILESLGSITCYGIACIGILIISTGIFLYIKHGLAEEDNQVLLSSKSNENDDIGTVNE